MEDPFGLLVKTKTVTKRAGATCQWVTGRTNVIEKSIEAYEYDDLRAPLWIFGKPRLVTITTQYDDNPQNSRTLSNSFVYGDNGQVVSEIRQPSGSDAERLTTT